MHCRHPIVSRRCPLVIRASSFLAPSFAALICLSLAACEASPPPATGSFSVVEAGIPELQAAMERGDLTSRQLVSRYLLRIGLYENELNAATAINLDALDEATELDAERARGEVRGPLHGIPVALKDNIHTTPSAHHRRRSGLRGLRPVL